MLETYRDALEDYMDMPGLERILDDVQSGEIELKFVESDVPSPVARALEFNFKAILDVSVGYAESGTRPANVEYRP